MDQGAGQGDLLRHSGRVVDHQTPTLILQAQRAEELMGPFGDHRATHAAQQARVAHELQPAQAVEEPQTVGQDAHQTLCANGVGPDIVTHHVSRADVRPQQPGRHRQGGGLSGAVGPHETEERPTRHLELETVNGEGRPECLGQATQAQRRRTSPRCHAVTLTTPAVMCTQIGDM